MADPIERVFVAGAGLMGHGVAQVHAAIGMQVVLYEPDLARAEAGRARVAGNLDRAVAKGRLTPADRDATLARIRSTADPGRVADADLVIEAVFEDLEVKSALWSELDGLAPEHAIFASNTSSIAIHRLAEAVSGERRERFVGMHFFSPVPVMPLIELIRGRDTSDETEAAIRALGDRLGKQVIVSADRPGFIVNRILMPFLAESMRVSRKASALRTTSTPAPGSASTTRWARSPSRTSSVSTSASGSCASSTTVSKGGSSGHRAS